jgi:anti-sigma factor RsiW
MTCREASNLLPLFLDGELDPRQMRVVAMHSMRCQTCELELKEMEHLQLLVSDSVKKRVNEIDFTQLWPAVERRITDVRIPWWSRLRSRWEEIDFGFDLRLPAMAVATALAVLAFTWFMRQPDVTQPLDSQRVAQIDYNSAGYDDASIEEIETTFPSVRVYSDPESKATVLWVTDENTNLEPMP